MDRLTFEPERHEPEKIISMPPDSSGSVHAQLLEKVKMGDADAFKEVFGRWEEPLFFFLRKFIGSQQDAEDICQETFAKLWINRATIDTSQKINFYIFRMGRQLAVNLLRDRQRRSKILDGPLVRECVDEHGFEQDMMARELELLAEYYIAKMPEKVRKVYELRYRENCSNEEIAQRLGITVNNVASHIYAARQRMKELFPVIAMIFLLKIN